MRMMMPHVTAAAAAAVDARIEESFASLADLAHSPPERRALSRSVASLRIREGGFELAAFSATRTALFLAAYVKSRPTIARIFPPSATCSARSTRSTRSTRSSARRRVRVALGWLVPAWLPHRGASPLGRPARPLRAAPRSGARDGKKHSNTYFFEKQLGWRGMLFEGDPSQLPNLRQNRPAAIVYEGAVCPRAQTELTFGISQLPGMSGAIRDVGLTLRRC
jgi:hypothetical protein